MADIVDIRKAVKPVVKAKDLNADGIEANWFRITRGGVESPKLATASEIDEFLDACGMPPGTPKALLAKTGAPFNIDGSILCLKAITAPGKIGQRSTIRPQEDDSDASSYLNFIKRLALLTFAAICGGSAGDMVKSSISNAPHWPIWIGIAFCVLTLPIHLMAFSVSRTRTLIIGLLLVCIVWFVAQPILYLTDMEWPQIAR